MIRLNLFCFILNLLSYVRISVAHIMLLAYTGDFRNAITYCSEYLNHRPHSNAAKRNLAIAKKKFSLNLLQQANEKFDSNDFESFCRIYEEYLGLVNSPTFGLRRYLIACIKKANPDYDFSDQNPSRLHLIDLDQRCSSKLDNEEQPTEEELNASNLVEYQVTHHVNFGRHDGSLIEEILNLDANYLIWCVINLGHFCLSNELFLDKRLKADPDYLQALEINLVKVQLARERKAEYDNRRFEERQNQERSGRDSYDNYEGSYAQEVEGWSDEDIDDVLGGDPDAYWNLD